jgi:hypothetical protein
MPQFSIKYRTIQNGKSYPGVNGAMVNASNVWEARMAFKATHYDSDKTKYVIVGVTRIGK